ncbi:MAG TPA: hypothetical protein PLM00_05020 [Spirochaetota bacterium]|nr:hypothetical protein [Spirochaetota bacterium]
MEAQTYPAHAGAKTAFTIVGILLCLLIITIPLAIWIIVASRRARVVVDDAGIRIKMFGSIRLTWDEIVRVGLLRIGVQGGGVAGIIVKKKVGGNEAVNLCLQDTRGKTRHCIISMYQNWEDIVEHVAQRTGRQCETLSRGFSGPKWPEG